MATTQQHEAGYDLVGQYNQDSINGFSEALIDRFIEIASPTNVELVIDAMGGDGNLSERILSFCNNRKLSPPKTLRTIDISRVQSEFAGLRFADNSGVESLWGYFLMMTNLNR